MLKCMFEHMVMVVMIVHAGFLPKEFPQLLHTIPSNIWAFLDSTYLL